MLMDEEKSRISSLIDPTKPARKIGQAVSEYFTRPLSDFDGPQL